MLQNLVETAGLRGTLTAGKPMSALSWLRVGGPADWLYQPADAEDLAAFLAAVPAAVPVMPVGVGSNLIIRDGGIEGAVIRLGRGFNGIEIMEDGYVRAGAAALDAHVARKAAQAGIDLAFLRTIPGAIGGAVRMNAGCYGSYMTDVFVSGEALTREGEPLHLTPDDLAFAYRSSALPEGAVITSVLMRGTPDAPDRIERKMEAALEKRAASQPVKDLSCGSTFRNPAGFSSTGRADDVHDLKAWKVIEDAGLRGARLGGAQMSEMHPNFLINTGDATAADLEGLGEMVREKVRAHSGVNLTWEIRRIGRT